MEEEWGERRRQAGGGEAGWEEDTANTEIRFSPGGRGGRKGGGVGGRHRKHRNKWVRALIIQGCMRIIILVRTIIVVVVIVIVIVVVVVSSSKS